jgi:hypothetical protein
LLLFGWVAAGAAMALPVSTSLESAGSKLGDRDPSLAASAAVGEPLALPFGVEVLTGNSNLDLLLEMQRAAPVTIVAPRVGASVGPARSTAPGVAAQAASRQAGFMPDLLFAGDAKMELQAPGARREWLGEVRSAYGGSSGDGGRSDTAFASAVDERLVVPGAEGFFQLRVKQFIRLLRDNRAWVLGTATLLVALGAVWKTFGRRL